MNQIDISIVSPDGSEVFFKAKKTIQFYKIFNAYKQRQAISSCIFFYGDIQINASDTPELLNMQDKDQIYSQIDNDFTIFLQNGDNIFPHVVKESTLLVSALTMYTNQSLRILFYYNGDEISISDTPTTLGMVDGSVIEIFTS